MDKLAVDLWGASIAAEGMFAIAAAILIIGILALAARGRP
jgi:hypothetical protein